MNRHEYLFCAPSEIFGDGRLLADGGPILPLTLAALLDGNTSANGNNNVLPQKPLTSNFHVAANNGRTFEIFALSSMIEARQNTANLTRRSSQHSSVQRRYMMKVTSIIIFL